MTITEGKASVKRGGGRVKRWGGNVKGDVRLHRSLTGAGMRGSATKDRIGSDRLLGEGGGVGSPRADQMAKG